MTDTLIHRGPDDFGYLQIDSRTGNLAPLSADVCLGNRRLAILDLSANGRQPLHNETRDVFVVHNGEIFNFLELRQVLIAKGHVFRSSTDTEVIVHAYEEWGADCVTRFNGMWAFALWDQRRRELFCSRDRFGIKPFYYYLDDDVLLFASEIKAILPALNARPRPAYGVVADYLLDGAVCHTRDTFFEGILRLEPAHNLVVSSGAFRSTRYWDYTTRSHAYDESRPVETFRELLHDAVRLRLRSDVPVGVALSGGLDSTTVLAEAASQSGAQPLHAFTAIFPSESYDEHEYARLAAHHCGAELHTIEYQPDHFLQDLRSILWHLDYPSPISQILPRWSLMRLASQHVKVILEGQGADELLAGYVARYFLPYLRDQRSRFHAGQRGDAVKDAAASCLALVRDRGVGACAGLLRQRLARALPQRHVAYTRDFLATARPSREIRRLFPDELTNKLLDDHAAAILPMLLKLGDAISMAHSLESRLPFLDYRLVELVFQLPVHHKFDRAQSKGILRQAMAGAIPERIRARRDKVGFDTPITRWIQQCLDQDIRPMLLSDRARARNIFDPRHMGRLLDARALRLSSAVTIFRCLSVELWFRMFIDGEGAPEPAPLASA